MEGLSALTKLSTLLLSHNELRTVADLAPLLELPLLACLDLQENRLEDDAAPALTAGGEQAGGQAPPATILDLLARLPALAVLYLQGNPCVKKTRHYRKQVVARLPGLKYLDDRPVFPEERSRCEAWHAAWVAGGEAAGAAAERAEVDRLAAAKKEEEDRNFAAFAEFTRRAAAGEPTAWEALTRGAGAGPRPQGGGARPRCPRWRRWRRGTRCWGAWRRRRLPTGHRKLTWTRWIRGGCGWPRFCSFFITIVWPSCCC